MKNVDIFFNLIKEEIVEKKTRISYLVFEGDNYRFYTTTKKLAESLEKTLSKKNIEWEFFAEYIE